jgi:hypothetical protein
LSPAPGEQPKLPIPASLIAGACAGVSSTLCTYPLELVKTRLTIQVCAKPKPETEILCVNAVLFLMGPDVFCREVFIMV